MRGIPRKRYETNLPVYGTNVGAKDIAITSSICAWNPECMAWTPPSLKGHAYYNSIVQLYADWGVDFIKCDDTFPAPTNDIQKAEVESRCAKPSTNRTPHYPEPVTGC
jgi:hypothetical protein